MCAMATARGWAWPTLSFALALTGVTVLAVLHQQVDLSTYLLGGAHATAPDLFRVTLLKDGLGFTYPPFSALLFAPFAHLDVRACQVVFSWVNLAALTSFIAVSLRAVGKELDRRTVLWWALVLVLPVTLLDPVRQTFLLGQVNIVLALIVVADLTMDLPLPRGILVGLAAAIKVTPLVFIPYLFLTRQHRAGARAVAAFCGAGLLAAAANASTSSAYWTRDIRDPQRAGLLSWIGNQGLLGALERLLGHALSTPIALLIALVAGAVGLVVAAGACRVSSPVLGLLVVEATESLASPVSWSHHFIWVVLLVAWLALAEDRPRGATWLAVGVATLFWAAPAWWVTHGPSTVFAGRGWLAPVADCDTLLFVALVLGAGYRVGRRLALRVSGPGPPTVAPSGAGS